jgi:hypothetical protein
MRHESRAIAVFSVLLLVSCGSGDQDDGSGTDTGSAARGGTGGASTGGPRAGSTAGNGGSSAAGSSAGGGECASGAGSGGNGAPLLQCNAIGPGSCSECIGEKCCDLLEQCAVDADCACMATCIGSESLRGVDGCLDTCGVSGSPRGFIPLAECVATTCPDSDECSVPSNFMPPPAGDAPGPMSNAGIGSGTLADCSFDAGLAYDPNGSVLQLESADSAVCVRLERRNEGRGSLANTQWTLLEMRVGPPGEVVLIDDPSSACWYSSHHNFNDWAHASSGTRRYDLKLALADHGAMPTYTLHVFEDAALNTASCPASADGACPIGEPIELFHAP